MDVDTIIKKLGGAGRAQSLLGVGASAISNYRTRGQFPEYARVKIWQALKARGIMVDPETLNDTAQTNHPATLISPPVILVIICGGIAAYKAMDLISRLKDDRIIVQVIMTSSAEHFITPLAVSALAENTVRSDLFSLTDESAMSHIQLAREADCVVVVPATANIIAKMAHGLADDLASTVLLATDKPIVLAPAMNPHMWVHEATVANMKILASRGVITLGPDSGKTACGEVGVGRLVETSSILGAITALLPGRGKLRGKTALVTSGPTHEPIDHVRYICNRSSGKQGHAIAAALAGAGASVTLISGPVVEPPPSMVKTVSVETADEMFEAVTGAMPVDIAVCVAAVGDWSPTERIFGKMKKNDAAPPPQIALKQNPDILAALGHHQTRPRLVIGFAAETQDVIAYAKAKRVQKGADWILANQVGRIDAPVFGEDTNQVTLVSDQEPETWPLMSKNGVAHLLTERITKEITR